jgi:asparagine synthase (glutamine-hydrolysing)
MCGISAVVSPRPERVRRTIDAMVSALQHRGPDGRGTWVACLEGGGQIALGHNRLSIFDLSERARQPMHTRDGRYVLVYNGAVYNFQELARELEPDERPAPGFGDTAIVLAALVKWGPAALAKFNGMWALLLYDRLERTLLVSRDRFGVKPLYVCRDAEEVFFASEAKAILEARQTRVPFNPGVVVPYLARGLLDWSTETFFVGIGQFPAASYQVIDVRRPSGTWPPPVRFWRHPVERGEWPEPGRVSPEEVRSVFLDAVRIHLRSDVPIGVLLSGGVDSSAITGAVAASGALNNASVLSVTSDDHRASEERHIDAMARHVGLAPLKVNVSNAPLSLLDTLADACWHNDAPLIGPSHLAYLRLMRIARAHGLKVLLSGQGADEQLGGYRKFFYFWLLSLLKAGRVAALVATVARSARRSDTLYEFRMSEAIRYMGRFAAGSRSFVTRRYRDLDRVDIGLRGSYAEREWVDLSRTSVPALLHYEDRLSMSQSIELRVPFLDHRLVECLARVHASEKFDGGWTKSIFRQAIAGLVPPEIQYRRDKKGFTVPDDGWMREVFRERVLSRFVPGMKAEVLGFVDPVRLRALYERYLRGWGVLNGRHFFRAYAFEVFATRFAKYLRV